MLRNNPRAAAVTATMAKRNQRALLLLPLAFLSFRRSAAQRHRPSLRWASASRRRPSAQPTSAPTRPNYSSNREVGGAAEVAKRGSGGGRGGGGGSSIISNFDHCGDVGQLFQLSLQIDRDSCETSWLLERTIADEELPYRVYVDGYHGDFAADDFASSSSSFSRSFCLREGEYQFTIYDVFGDGIAAPGHYILALDGVVLAGSSNFGYEEVTRFTVVSRRPESATSSSADGSSSTDADYDLDDTFSTMVPERLSGIIDLSLVPTAHDNHDRGGDMLEDVHNSTQTAWMEILNDDFETGFGIFHSSALDASDYVTYYPFVKERRGVIRLQNENRGEGNALSSSVYSDHIAIPTGMTTIKLVFSYYANSMELHDGFCIDYSIDYDGGSATTWHSKKCWHAMEDFDNGVWHDDVHVMIHLGKDHGVKADTMVDSFRIRFRCKTDSLHDDVLIDRVLLLGSVDETVLKDSL